MSWRPKTQSTNLSMQDFKGLADANPSLTKNQQMTDIQMAAELERRGWKVTNVKK